uniref:AlNc14C67G4726 protein n=1 Tax=Albugo laibachii Nc14 TaxID=890382 RepID=F0WDK7_9STRA|nr:AlNc14C67G4726 [Albugo laibachii Nc14]|eukprot:CCA19281.1 AlNc14C67G4726 [Albugo laibachii Nc14]
MLLLEGELHPSTLILRKQIQAQQKLLQDTLEDRNGPDPKVENEVSSENIGSDRLRTKPSQISSLLLDTTTTRDVEYRMTPTSFKLINGYFVSIVGLLSTRNVLIREACTLPWRLAGISFYKAYNEVAHEIVVKSLLKSTIQPLVCEDDCSRWKRVLPNVGIHAANQSQLYIAHTIAMQCHKLQANQVM